jgi:hypothetical protein
MERLRADVARLALGVVCAFLGRDRDGLRVLRVCMKLLGAACLFYFFTELIMAAFFPVLFLARGAAVACAAAAAFLAR